MRDWEKLFEILQALNPESDKFLVDHESALDEDESTERWEDICFYMDLLKPEEEK
tara:strand:+ start:22385 stop:22549 length:165 start_codon:yes stop_codon:yes gene_type:complete